MARSAWLREWQGLLPAERWESVDLATLPPGAWPTVLWDCLGEECYLQFAAFAYDGFETCARHPHREMPCPCEGGAARFSDSVARVRNNDDLLTGVSFAERQARLGEVIRIVLAAGA